MRIKSNFSAISEEFFATAKVNIVLIFVVRILGYVLPTVPVTSYSFKPPLDLYYFKVGVKLGCFFRLITCKVFSPCVQNVNKLTRASSLTLICTLQNSNLSLGVTGFVGVCDRLKQKSWSPLSVSCVAARKDCQTLCLGAPPRYSLVVDEDVKKPTNQTNKQTHAGCQEW